MLIRSRKGAAHARLTTQANCKSNVAPNCVAEPSAWIRIYLWYETQPRRQFLCHILILQFLFYPNDPIPETNNVQITPFPGNLTKTRFVYDNDDHYFFANTTPTSSLYFDDDKLSLDHQAAPFFIDQTGLVSYQEYDGSYKRDDFYTDFYAAPQDTVMQNKRDYCQPESVIYEVAFY